MNIAKNKYVGLALLVAISLVFAQCGGGSKGAMPKGGMAMPTGTPSQVEGKTVPKGAKLEGAQAIALAPFQGAIQFPHAVSSFAGMDKGVFGKIETILKNAAPAIAKVAKELPKGSKLVIVGHADPIGGAAAAYNYGYARALTVRTYLIKNGVPADKLAVFSAAANDLQNKTDIKADVNHRVTFTIQK